MIYVWKWFRYRCKSPTVFPHHFPHGWELFIAKSMTIKISEINVCYCIQCAMSWTYVHFLFSYPQVSNRHEIDKMPLFQPWFELKIVWTEVNVKVEPRKKATQSTYYIICEIQLSQSLELVRCRLFILINNFWSFSWLRKMSIKCTYALKFALYWKRSFNCTSTTLCDIIFL